MRCHGRNKCKGSQKPFRPQNGEPNTQDQRQGEGLSGSAPKVDWGWGWRLLKQIENWRFRHTDAGRTERGREQGRARPGLPPPDPYATIFSGKLLRHFSIGSITVGAASRFWMLYCWVFFFGASRVLARRP